MILQNKTILDFIAIADKHISIPDNFNVSMVYAEKEKILKIQISGYSKKHPSVQVGFSKDIKAEIEPTDGEGKVYLIMETVRKLDPAGRLFVNIPKVIEEDTETPVYEESTKTTTHCKVVALQKTEKPRWTTVDGNVEFSNRCGLMQLRKVMPEVTAICIPYVGDAVRALSVIEADISLAPKLEEMMTRKSTKPETKPEDINTKLAVAAAESKPVQPPLPPEYQPTEPSKAEGPIMPAEDAALIAQAEADTATKAEPETPVETEEQKEAKRKAPRRSAAQIREDEKAHGIELLIEDGYAVLPPLDKDPKKAIGELVKLIHDNLFILQGCLSNIPESAAPDPVQIEILANKRAAEIIAKVAADMNK